MFGREQMYVAVWRVTSPFGLKIFTVDEDMSHNGLTKNIVYHEIFDNLVWGANKLLPKRIVVNENTSMLLLSKDMFPLYLI